MKAGQGRAPKLTPSVPEGTGLRGFPREGSMYKHTSRCWELLLRPMGLFTWCVTL